MSMFIKLEVSAEVASQPDLVSKLVEICPVDIFDQDDGKLRIVDENEDECTLCDLCIEAAPEGAVNVIKLYED